MAVDLKGVKALRDETGLGFMDCKKALDEASGNREEAVLILRKKGLAAAEGRSHRSAEQGVVGLFISPDGARGALVELRCETDFVARGDEFRKLAEDLADLAATMQGGQTETESFLGEALGSGKGTVGDEIKAIGGKVGEKVVLHRVASMPAPKAKRHRIGGYAHHNGRCGSLVRLSFEEEPTAGSVDDLLKDLAMHVTAHVPVPLAVSKDDIPSEVIERERVVQADTDEIKSKPEKIRGKILQGKMQKFLQEKALLEQPLVTVTDSKVAVREVLAKKSKELSDSLVVDGFLRFQLGEG